VSDLIEIKPHQHKHGPFNCTDSGFWRPIYFKRDLQAYSCFRRGRQFL